MGRWGYYSINDSVIRATLFRHDPSRFNAWIKEELQFRIENSEKILLIRSTCDRCKNQYSGYGDKSKILFNQDSTAADRNLASIFR